MSRHAEIAGAGFAGLVAAIALAQRGWTVRVHERTPFVRAEGFGLSTQENMLKVLEALGVRDEVVRAGQPIRQRLVLDAAGRELMRSGGGFGYRVSRRRIIEALARRAEQAGVEVLTDSIAAGADPEGFLLLNDGRRLKADLVIAADGINSAVRESLAVRVSRTLRRDGAMRVLVPKPDVDDPSREGSTRESWSGRRRFIVSRTRPDELYVAMSCLASDRAAREVPLDAASWSRTFPALASFFQWMTAHADWSTVRWVQFQTLKLDRWHRGRVAIVGDAAHAMPPDLGQGAGCAMMNGLSLAVYVSEGKSLEAWERAERPLTEHTQRWAGIYGGLANLPGPLRGLAFGAMGKSKWLHNQYQRTARHVPTGTLESRHAG